jgi:CRISPR/Cas system-associated protein Cas10 (large subunit of type III CRISPR-Cas system)
MSQAGGPIVELRPAFIYTCEHCGRDSALAVVLRETRDVTHLMVPAMFKCDHCQKPLRGVPITSDGS